MRECFTLRHDGRKHRVALTSLYPATRNGQTDAAAYYVGCGVYRQGPARMDWTGMSIHGEIPVAELVRWGLRKGYLNWEQKDWGHNPEGGVR